MREFGTPLRVGQPAFQLNQVSKVYGSGASATWALREVDIDFFSGEFAVLLGPSGSGKSTLLNLLGALDRATSGVIQYRDHDLAQASESQLTSFRRDHVGFVFQFYNLIHSLTALENVALVTELAADSGLRPMRPEEALERVGLQNKADSYPSELSGGEQQRVAIARAISKRPELLLCDEPTGALDVSTGKWVLQALVDANRELGTLVVVITHNAAIAGLANRVIQLASGQVKQITTPKQRLNVADIEW
jgi:putative ABC transport system ATP-binding protein